ncbi:DegT/DnrJ/EryC1/StrS family aminotransferase [uncultured Dokdonia sp.]|uniref:DegT/DnrJ/EryC1/StrS family aminotransferase n=1 Tax=uncultured Dokdonia sp. TaxID=575653 RepID=UPI00262D1260|nr:DegT/DnrJ/EryC1/StrS family aminotransferase [uncultured Dokdonia sp.]
MKFKTPKKLLTRIPLSEATKSAVNFDVNDFTFESILDFEKFLETRFFKGKRVYALNSGTSAIHLALELLNIKGGDEVICQTATYIATAVPIIYQNATPIFVDSEKETGNICPEQLEIAILDRIHKGVKPKAIIVVDLYGMPYNAEKVNKIALKYNIPIIEDAAEALGAKFDDVYCGNLGDIGVLSFNTNKIFTTLGGGALVVASDEAYDMCHYLATHAREDKPYYEHKRIGYNYRMAISSAVFGLSQVDLIDENIEKRKEIKMFYQNIFNSIKGTFITQEPSEAYQSNFWLSILSVDLNVYKPTIIEELQNAFHKENIESRFTWKPMHMQPLFENCTFYGGNVAFHRFKKGLCLPSGSNLTKQERQRIEKIIFAILSKEVD